MKKTYIKITSLILVLITAVVLLGATLFTYIQVSSINTLYISDLHNNHQLPAYNYDIDSEPAEPYMISHMGSKYIPTMSNPGIGYYGEIDWRWKTANAAHHIESSDYKRAIVSVVKAAPNTTTVYFTTDKNSNSGNAVYFNGDSEWRVAFVYADDMKTTVSGNVGLSEFLVSAEEQNEDPYISKLDQEAKVKYAEIKGSLNPEMTRSGWLTSFVVYTSDTSVANDQIKIKECDVYVFHPLELVVKSYSYVYILFLVVLIVLLFLTIFLMRRMYKSRVSYEARTKNLTRSFAHELKTPLAVTKSYIENWDIIDEKERPEVASKINSEVDHMTKMVNTLLDLSKMDTGDVKLNLEEVDLYALAKVCYKHVEELAKERKITVGIKKEKEDGEYIVSADLDMMRMCISNFLSNAIKYGKTKADILLVSGSNNVTFRITNDGEPISKKDQKKIWDLFYKKDKSGTDRLGSTGVGLAVNKSILELHKAKIGLDSNAEGTTFWFEMKKAK